MRFFNLVNLSKVAKFNKITNLNLTQVHQWQWAFRLPNLNSTNTKWEPFRQNLMLTCYTVWTMPKVLLATNNKFVHNTTTMAYFCWVVVDVRLDKSDQQFAHITQRLLGHGSSFCCYFCVLLCQNWGGVAHTNLLADEVIFLYDKSRGQRSCA